MSTSDRGATIGTTLPRLTRVARWAAAVVVSGVFAAVAWMFVLQEVHTGQIFGRSGSQSNFPEGLGLAIGAEEPNRAGGLLGIGLGIAFAMLFAVVERFLPGRGWRKGLTFAVLPFLAWGLLYTPFANSREVVTMDPVDPSGSTILSIDFASTGPFGWGAGRGTIPAAVVASLLAGLLLARLFPLMRGESWWKEHPVEPSGLDVDDLLELSKKRTEQGGKRPGG